MAEQILVLLSWLLNGGHRNLIRDDYFKKVGNNIKIEVTFHRNERVYINAIL